MKLFINFTSISNTEKIYYFIFLFKFKYKSVISNSKSPKTPQVSLEGFCKATRIFKGINSGRKEINDSTLKIWIQLFPFFCKVWAVFNAPLFLNHVLSYILLQGSQMAKLYQFFSILSIRVKAIK